MDDLIDRLFNRKIRHRGLKRETIIVKKQLFNIKSGVKLFENC